MNASHRVVLALSFAASLGEPRRKELLASGRSALARLDSGTPPVVEIDEPDVALLRSVGVDDLHGDAGEAFAVFAGLGAVDWERGEAVEAAELLRRLRADERSALLALAPPWAAFARVAPAAPLLAATDACGLHHVFACGGEGWSGLSTSCLALAALRGEGLDWEALGAYARTGLYLEEQTPVRGVRRLLRGTLARIEEGRLRLEGYAPPPAEEPRLPADQAVEAGSAALRAATLACLDSHPGAGLSLSGGLDSRLLLAAVPRERRGEIGGVTLGTPRDADWQVAHRVARVGGVETRGVDLAGFAARPGDEVLDGVRRASLRRDHRANPLAVAVLEWAEDGLPPAPRLNGQNGEFARGFYYAGQPLDGEVTSARIERLLQWRLLASDSASPRLLERALRREVDEALRARISALLREGGRPWPDALDEFYLRARMQSWAGTEISRSSARRIDLSPFFDPRFLAFARRTDAHEKRGSRLLARVLAALDPALAALPLDGRPAPAALAHDGWITRAAGLALSGRKLWKKLRQRLGGPAAAAPGAPLVRRILLERGIAPLLQRVGEAEAFDRFALAALLDGSEVPDVATLGFLLDVEWMLEFLEG